MRRRNSPDISKNTRRTLRHTEKEVFHRSFYITRSALLLDVMIATSVAYVIHFQRAAICYSSVHACNQMWATITALCFGSLVIVFMLCSIYVFHPISSEFLTTVASKRLELSRLLSLFFGVAYIFRAIRILKSSHWQNHYFSLYANFFHQDNTAIATFTDIWIDGGLVSALLVGVGSCWVLVSWVCGSQLRTMRKAIVN